MTALNNRQKIQLFKISLPFPPPSFPSQIHYAVISIITAWWWFKPDCVFTHITEVSAVRPALVPRKHTPTLFKTITYAGDAAVKLKEQKAL